MAKSNAEKRAAFIESLRTDSVSPEQADEKREQVTGNNASDNEDNNESNGENKGEAPELERSLDEEVGEER